MNNTARITTISLIISLMFSASGCSDIEPRAQAIHANVETSIKKNQEKSDQIIPVVTSTSAPWLMGAPVQIAEPQLPILSQTISYHPTNTVSLADVAAWVTQKTGLVVDIAELQTTGTTGSGLTGSSLTSGMAMPSVPSIIGASGVPSIGGLTSSTVPQQQQNMYSMFVNYQGSLSGLLDVIGNKSSAWWKVVDGRISFYRTESKTFYLPSIARKFTGDSTITSETGGSSNGSSGTGVSTGATSNGGANSVSNYLVDFWADLATTAKIVSAGGQVATNQSTGSITVTGTPSQVRNVEKWVRSLSDQLSQQVAITMHVYSVKVTNEDNYSFNPTVVFKNVSGTFGYNISGVQSPSIVSGLNPFNLGVSLLTNTATGETTQYSGSQLAFKALSTLGDVTESLQQTVVTLNGQPAPVQIANLQGYLASSSTTLTANVGSTVTLTPGTITTGFTAMFLPRIVNGKIILGMTMQNSSSNGFTNITSAGATIQNPNVDSNSNQQSISLTPGDALMLTGLQKDSASINKNGVGKPSNYLVGGGIDNTIGKTMIAIVITAKIL